MKLKNLYKGLAGLVAVAAMAPFTACSDDDMSKSIADFDPNYKGEVGFDVADFTIEWDETNVEIEFSSDMDWTASVYDEAEGDGQCSWATVSPASGEAGENLMVMVTCQPNDDINNARVAKVQILTSKGKSQVFTIQQNYQVIVLDPADIPDYDKYIFPTNEPHFTDGPEYMLRHDSYYSWHRMKQSEHFFVFWSPEFGDDPSAPEHHATGMYVDVDDLLEKAEMYFDTNINKLHMATLGQGKSMLDNYKMQIYLIYQDEWLATGGGYKDKIGALWVNPATCHPVGSTIAHEIGHSFQYQTYADRINCQGAPNDFLSGYRYGFYGIDGSGNGGCGYWEQCAQWQAQRDYPNEQFESYNYQVWLDNCHRHFHHEWMRYASYWLQSYWVEKSGIEAYGRIWTESVSPEDAISTYTRLYNGNNYSTTREQLFDYAMRMATYDIKDVRNLATNYQDRYRTDMVYDMASGKYQVTYANCPGATGFNVISLTVPTANTEVSVDFEGLAYGAPLHAKDKGKVVDGDGKNVGNTRNYNAVGGAENMGWRYGFVAYLGNSGTRVYGDVGKDKNGHLTFKVPAGTTYLFLVVQGSPEIYMPQGWDDNELNDPQFPYTIKLTGTDVKYYEEEAEPVYTVVDDNNMTVDILVNPSASTSDYPLSSIMLNETPVLQFLGLSESEFTEKFVDLPSGQTVEPSEGTIVLGNLESNGTMNFTGSSGNGFWVDANGDRCTWGDNAMVYSERGGAELTLGHFPGHNTAGSMVEMRPAVIYTAGGVTKTVQYKVIFRFK